MLRTPTTVTKPAPIGQLQSLLYSEIGCQYSRETPVVLVDFVDDDVGVFGFFNENSNEGVSYLPD